MEKCNFYKKYSKYIPSKQVASNYKHDLSFYYCSHMCADKEISENRVKSIGSNNNLTCGGDIDNSCQCDFSSIE